MSRSLTIADKDIWLSGARNTTNCQSKLFVWRPKPGIEIPFNYTNWSSGRPNCYGGNEHCVQFFSTSSYEWNDESCNSTMYPLCEYDPYL